MVISGITYSPYHLKLKTPLLNSKNIISSRNGYIIQIFDAEGNTGIGEAAPLPEFGSENMDECLKAIYRFISEYTEELHSIEDITSVLSGYTGTPAARHGIEQALLNLFSAATGVSLPELLNTHFNSLIKINSLIGFLEPDVCAFLASKMAGEGYDTIKMKAGRQHFQHDIEAVKAVREAVGSKINIRLDINGKWEYREALKNIEVLSKFCPEYIEQPVTSKDDLIKLASVSIVKIAADESVRDVSETLEIIDRNQIDVLVLKPMMLGGIIDTTRVIRAAEKNNIMTVISSSFETSVGLRSCLLLAGMVKEKYAHGLSTLDYFITDLYKSPFIIEKGTISIKENFLLSVM